MNLVWCRLWYKREAIRVTRTIATSNRYPDPGRCASYKHARTNLLQQSRGPGRTRPAVLSDHASRGLVMTSILRPLGCDSGMAVVSV